MRAKEFIFENLDDENLDLKSINLARQNIARILAAAQHIYDQWDESEVDTYAGGGICHLIADAICDVMGDIGIECTPVSCSYEQHVYVAVRVAEGVYTIDIPYSIYETGGGFSWQKLPNVKFDSRDVVFYRASGDPDEFENYTSLEEATDNILSLRDNAGDGRAQKFIDAVYARYPDTFQNNHVMSWGSGEQQEIALFELVPNIARPNSVDIKWIQAYPLRQGIGSRAMKILQSMAQEHGVALTLYPWDKGQVSQSKLMKFYRQMGFRPTSKGSKNMIWQGVAENNLSEGLHIDVPNKEWLQGKIDYAKKKGRDRFGAPGFNATTAYYSNDVRVPIEILRQLPGMRGEQQNVRQQDFEAIKKILKDTGRLPITKYGKEYVPFVMVAYNGEAWVNEGNHRIMAAAELYDEGDKRFASLPIELKYFDGGERIKSGPLYPGRLSQQDVAENFADGKNPGRKGLAKRVGVPTKASVSRLRQIAKSSSGEKQRMAHWMANMKAGKKK